MTSCYMLCNVVKNMHTVMGKQCNCLLKHEDGALCLCYITVGRILLAS